MAFLIKVVINLFDESTIVPVLQFATEDKWYE